MLDQLHRVAKQGLEIVAGVELASRPLKPEPFNVFANGVDVLRVFLHRIRVVETKVHLAPIFLGQAEVHANSLRVADVQESIWLRRKPCVHTPVVQPRLPVGIDDLLNEVTPGMGFFVPVSRDVGLV